MAPPPAVTRAVPPPEATPAVTPQRQQPGARRGAPATPANTTTKGPNLALAFDEARAAMNRGDLSAAIAGLESILLVDPAYPKAADLLDVARNSAKNAARTAVDAGAKAEADRDDPEAERQYQRALQADPQSTAAQDAIRRVKARMQTEGEDAFKRARQYDALGRAQDAIPMYEKAIQLLPSDHASVKVARERLACSEGRGVEMRIPVARGCGIIVIVGTLAGTLAAAPPEPQRSRPTVAARRHRPVADAHDQGAVPAAEVPRTLQLQLDLPKKDWMVLPSSGVGGAHRRPARRATPSCSSSDRRCVQPLDPADITDLFAQIETDAIKERQPKATDFQSKVLDSGAASDGGRTIRPAGRARGRTRPAVPRCRSACSSTG